MTREERIEMDKIDKAIRDLNIRMSDSKRQLNDLLSTIKEQKIQMETLELIKNEK